MSESTPELTEAQVKALAEYRALSPEDRDKLGREWADIPEWKKQDLRDEVEFDLA